MRFNLPILFITTTVFAIFILVRFSAYTQEDAFGIWGTGLFLGIAKQ
jgi:hypothetical protein